MACRLAAQTEALDGLGLLACGAVLSQVISRMVEYQASDRSPPDAAPIPQVAHSLIGGVLADVRKHHSQRDIDVAAAILGEATEAIIACTFFGGPELN